MVRTSCLAGRVLVCEARQPWSRATVGSRRLWHSSALRTTPAPMVARTIAEVVPSDARYDRRKHTDSLPCLSLSDIVRWGSQHAMALAAEKWVDIGMLTRGR